MVKQANIETHYIGIINSIFNWSSYNQMQKNEIVLTNNIWGRSCATADGFLIAKITTDSVYYDITPLLKSNHNYTVRKTINYLAKNNNIKTDYLNQIFQTKSGHIKKACLDNFSKYFNNNTESLLLADLKKSSTKDFHAEILSVLSINGSEKSNAALQKNAIKNIQNLVYYNYYITSKDYKFFLEQLKFYNRLKKDNTFSKKDFDMALENLELRIKLKFNAIDQLDALEKIDLLKQ